MTLSDPNRLLRAFGLARLAVAALLLAVGPLLPEELMPGANRAVLALTLLAMVLTSAALARLLPVAKPHRIAWLVCLLDTALVTRHRGGHRRPPLDLRLPLRPVGDRRPACCSPASAGSPSRRVSSVLYTGLVFGRTVLPLTAFFETPKESTALEIVTIFLNAGTFLVVAIVAGGLAERFRSTRAELETKQANLRDLEAFTDLIFQSVGTGIVARRPRAPRDRVQSRRRAHHRGVRPADAIGQPWTRVRDSVALDAHRGRDRDRGR